MKYTAFSINNDPQDQPTPKLVWGKYIKDIDLKVDTLSFLPFLESLESFVCSRHYQ